MQITLNNEEIQEAITNYTAGQGIDLSIKEISVVLQPGRGERGHSALVDINPKPKKGKKSKVKVVGDTTFLDTVAAPVEEEDPILEVEEETATDVEEEEVEETPAKSGSLFNQP